MIYTQEINAVAVITKERNYTYGELLQLIESYAQLFHDKNYDKIAIYSENRIDWIAALYAGWKNDCTVVTIDYMASRDDVSYILNDCKPNMIFASPNLKDEVTELCTRISYSPDIAYFGESDLPAITKAVEWKEPADVEKTAVIIYTSGTTGSPKGVMLSYKNLIANVLGVSREVEIFTRDRQVLMLLPLHHIFPLAGSMAAPLFVGGTIVMSPSMQSPDILETLKNNNVAIMIGVPRLYEIMYKGIKAKVDATAIGRLFYRIVKFTGSKKLAKKIFKKVHVGFGGNLKFLVSGGAALPKHVGEFFQTLGFDVLEGFGMTEAAPMITFTRPGNVKVGSPGHPLPGIKVEIRDGEIVAKGDNVMKGYYNRPQETADVLKDGWLYTGDLGHFDKKGFLHITGRKKDIIVLSNGKNVNPVELETRFEKSFNEVKEAGVFLHQGNLHVAVLCDTAVLDSMGVNDFENHFRNTVLPKFNSDLTSYNRIMKFVFVNNELPRTRLGKIQRFKLAEFIEKENHRQTPTDYIPSEDFLAMKTFLESQVDMDVLPNHHIEFDLALDSLGKLSFIDFIDKSFGVNLDEKKLINFPSLRHLADYVREKRQWFKQETINWAEALKEKVDVKLPKSWPTHNLLRGVAKYFFKIYFRFKAEGLHNIPDGPCIIAPNHQSFFDGLFVASFLKRKTIKQTYFYAKKKHVNNAVLRFMASTHNVIVMDLEQNLKESIQKMAAALKAGKKVIIFPEGTRTKTGKMGEFKKTFAILSTELNIPVVPVAIDGAGRAMPIGSAFPRFWAKVNVQFLEPVMPDGHTPESLIEGVYKRIEQSLHSTK